MSLGNTIIHCDCARGRTSPVSPLATQMSSEDSVSIELQMSSETMTTKPQESISAAAKRRSRELTHDVHEEESDPLQRVSINSVVDEIASDLRRQHDAPAVKDALARAWITNLAQ